MLGITMTKARGRESIARIVNDHRAEYDLITSVHIHIGNGEVMETITKPRRIAVVAIPAPTLRQLVGLLVHIEGTELMTRVTTTSQEDAGITTIQIRCTKVMLGGTVARIAGTPHRSIVALATFKTR